MFGTEQRHDLSFMRSRPLKRKTQSTVPEVKALKLKQVKETNCVEDNAKVYKD